MMHHCCQTDVSVDLPKNALARSLDFVAFIFEHSMKPRRLVDLYAKLVRIVDIPPPKDAARVLTLAVNPGTGLPCRGFGIVARQAWRDLWCRSGGRQYVGPWPRPWTGPGGWNLTAAALNLPHRPACPKTGSQPLLRHSVCSSSRLFPIAFWLCRRLARPLTGHTFNVADLRHFAMSSH